MKHITKKFQKLGFELIGESDAGVTYARDNHAYRHIISISRTLFLDLKTNKWKTPHVHDYLIKSYREDMNPDGWFDALSLEPKEWKLVYKAYKRHKHKYARKNYNA